MNRHDLREVFIFIAGATPQIITETIYALAVKSPPVLPDEICIVTTVRGREIAYDALIKDGILKKLSDEYALPPLLLSDASFVVPTGPDETPLEDIRSEVENEIMGDLITSLVREKSQDSSVRLHCFLPGGRKVISFYLGSTMQLFARPWDRLYHVLVTPGFESSHESFYRPRENAVLEIKGKRNNSAKAEITLSELPFIRLRGAFPLEAQTFKNLVREGQQKVDATMLRPAMEVSLSDRSIRIGACPVRFQPLHLMSYLACLRYKLDRYIHSEKAYFFDCEYCFPLTAELTSRSALKEMVKDYASMVPARLSNLLHHHSEGLDDRLISQAISKIRKILSDELGDEDLAS